MKFSGDGTPYLSKTKDATTGLPGPFFSLGCADQLNIKLNQNKWTHTEKCTGERGIDATGIKELSGTFDLDISDYNAANLALGLAGTPNAQTTGTVTSETLINTLVVGDIVALAHMGVASLVVTDSAGTPATVTSTKYHLEAETGLLTFLDVGTYTQPFKAAYTWTDPAYVAMLNAGIVDRVFRFSYVNKQNALQRGLVELYRVNIDPTSTYEVINDELQILKLTGTLLIDTTKAADSVLGRFGRTTLPPTP